MFSIHQILFPASCKMCEIKAIIQNFFIPSLCSLSLSLSLFVLVDMKSLIMGRLLFYLLPPDTFTLLHFFVHIYIFIFFLVPFFKSRTCNGSYFCTPLPPPFFLRQYPLFRFIFAFIYFFFIIINSFPFLHFSNPYFFPFFFPSVDL